MAGDWIKMRTDLYRDPKVCAIADELMHQEGELAAYVNQNCQRSMTVTRNVMRNVTVGALVTVWGVMRLRGKRVNDDLVLKFGTLWIIDDLSELPGFGQALANVGWVEADEQGIVFPNFFCEYNVDPNEDAKAKAAERQRRYREKQHNDSDGTRNVTVTSQSNAREEKRREEKSINTEANASVVRATKKCPASFEVTADLMDWATEKCPLVSQATETATFRDYTFSRAISDWDGAWRNWMRKSQKDAEKQKQSQTGETAYQRAQREKMQKWAPGVAAKAPDFSQPFTIDEVSHVAAIESR